MKVGAADQGLAPLLKHALLDALAISIGPWIDFAGHLQPNKVADLLIRDLILDHLGAPIGVGTEDLHGRNRPAVIALLANREGLAVLGRRAGPPGRT